MPLYKLVHIHNGGHASTDEGLPIDIEVMTSSALIFLAQF